MQNIEKLLQMKNSKPFFILFFLINIHNILYSQSKFEGKINVDSGLIIWNIKSKIILNNRFLATEELHIKASNISKIKFNFNKRNSQINIIHFNDSLFDFNVFDINHKKMILNDSLESISLLSNILYLEKLYILIIKHENDFYLIQNRNIDGKINKDTFALFTKIFFSFEEKKINLAELFFLASRKPYKKVL